jgi:5-methylcytosine-specific restriction protein A
MVRGLLLHRPRARHLVDGVAMSYAPRRPKITDAQRRFILERENGCCYLCRLPIDGPFDVDHELARELGGSDGIENLRPAHNHCHRQKSKGDVRAIAKSNRVRQKHGLDPIRRKAKPKMRSGNRFPPKGSVKMQSRGFDQRKNR